MYALEVIGSPYMEKGGYSFRASEYGKNGCKHWRDGLDGTSRIRSSPIHTQDVEELSTTTTAKLHNIYLK